VMIIDVPVLLIHSFLFFILCGLLSIVDKELTSAESPYYLVIFLVIYNCTIIINAFWLLSLKTKGIKEYSEFHWMWNNLIFGLIGLIFIKASLVFSFSPFFMFYASTALFMLNSLSDHYFTGWAYVIGKT